MRDIEAGIRTVAKPWCYAVALLDEQELSAGPLAAAAYMDGVRRELINELTRRFPDHDPSTRRFYVLRDSAKFETSIQLTALRQETKDASTDG